MTNPIDEYNYFEKWYNKLEKEFLRVAPISKEVAAYYAFLEGIKYNQIKQGELKF